LKQSDHQTNTNTYSRTGGEKQKQSKLNTELAEEKGNEEEKKKRRLNGNRWVGVDQQLQLILRVNSAQISQDWAKPKNGIQQ